MRIVRLRVDGFGPLQGEWTFSPDRVNVILDDNERGKSSLFAAIGAALYGLEGDRRSHRVVTPIERWRPWNGDAFRVTLDVETADDRLTITRDFDRGTVSVFDRTGREATADFLEGRDEYPVGTKLLGLDAAEFEKTALLLQGEMDVVVPGDEKARRASTLKSRLETAADTHIGDTNATEALKVLEDALRRYNAQELDFTGTIDNALDRLAARRELVEVEMRELDGALAGAQAPLERLHQLTEEERRLQDKLRDLENERRAGLAGDVKRQLADHEAALAEVTRLEAEASELAGMANLPPNTEVELREAVTRHEEAARGLEGLESRRRAELAREREAIDAERKDLAAYEDFTQEEADRCVGQAAELRNLVMQDALLRHQVFELRDGLAVKGYEPEKAQYLQERFATLPSDKLRLLRQQSELNLLFQTEATTLEQQRTGATETLRAVDAARAARRTPGWSLLALGAAGLVAGGVVLALALSSTLGVALLAAGGAMAAAGGALLAMGARTREQDRVQALALLAEAQSRINQLHHRRAENEAGLLELSRVMGYRDHVDLMRLWNDYSRLLDDAGPLVRAQEQLETAERRRNQLMEEARPLLEAAGEKEVTPELLEKVAYDARRSLNARQKLADLERGFGWVEEEKTRLDSAAKAMRERAIRHLQAAGIPYDATKGWAHHVGEIKRRMEGRVRYSMIVEELVPAARRRLHPDHEVTQRRRQLEMLLAGGEPPGEARPSAEIEGEVKRTRSKLEETQRRRSDARVEVEEVWRRHAQRRPELELAQETFSRAIDRAKKFKKSVEIAHETIQRVAVDTHRKWADYLNERVTEILSAFGGSVDGLRFGEDLDFSVQLDGGPLVSRGKAHAQLSAGARDQLYLAVRLAVSEFLSRGKEPIPLLLDDVFATSDDERLRAGMRALIESFGAGHQVLVTTCHRGRMQELQRMDPELYRDHVHWVDLRSGFGVRQGSEQGRQGASG